MRLALPCLSRSSLVLPGSAALVAVGVVAVVALVGVGRASAVPGPTSVPSRAGTAVRSGAATGTHRPAPGSVLPRPSSTPDEASEAPARPSTGAVAAGPAGPAGSGWAALDAAVDRIPGYGAHLARWSVVAAAHPWGETSWPSDDITVSRLTPTDRLDDVVRHEWAHVLQDRAYDHDSGALQADLDRSFGGRGTAGAERAADCMARELGARWTHYTACDDPAQRALARELLAGHRLVAGAR